MNYKILLPLIMFSVSILACSKTDSDTSTRPQETVVSTWYSGKTLLIDDLALYTSNGVIKDPEIIQQYLNRNFNNQDIQKHFYVNKTSVENHGISTTLNFLYGNRVELNGKIMEITGTDNNSNMLVSEYDFTDAPGSYTRCDILSDKVLGLNSQTDCPSNSCTKYRKTYPIIVSGQDFYLPVIFFGVSNSRKEFINGVETDIKCSSVAEQYPMINILNQNLSASLIEGDTVLVQTGRLPLVSKKSS
jgi:hypothetical protein